MDQAVVTTGDGNTTTVNHFHAPPARSSAALREAYLHHVLRAAGRFSLAGVDPGAAGRESEGVELHAVYTALLTLGHDVEARGPRGEMLDPHRAPRPLTAVEQLDRHARLVLLGDPGGGKSTFLNFAAMCLAGEGLRDKRVNLKALTTSAPRDEVYEEGKLMLPPRQTMEAKVSKSCARRGAGRSTMRAGRSAARFAATAARSSSRAGTSGSGWSSPHTSDH